jgi:small-conductance mechanosensitive channel
MRVCVAGVLAIALAIAMIAPALAQSPAAGSRAASAAPSTQAVAGAVSTGASQPAAAARPASAATPAPANASAAAQGPDAHAVIFYLSHVIDWYQHLGAEAQLVNDPEEALFFADDRQTAGQVLKLAFDYARAQAAVIAKINPNAAAAPGVPGSATDNTGVSNVTQTYKTIDASANVLRGRIKDLQTQLAKVPASQRAGISSEIQELQSELDLKEARINTFKALVQFRNGSSSADQSGSLESQIDELDHSISDSSKKTFNPPVEAAAVSSNPTGIISLVRQLFALSNKLDGLNQSLVLAQGLADNTKQLRKSMLALISSLVAQGNALGQGTGTADIATLKDRTKSFESLLEEYKLARDATLPLVNQLALLGVYTNNVDRWHAAVDQRWNKAFRSLIIRLIVLGASLALIFLGSLFWKWLSNRYVTDIRRRGQVMAARRLVLGLLIVIVVMINFSDELGSAATVLGFAAAGIAFALQNVILSIAGYFFLIGRFGIKAGDRVQIGGVTGDVIDIGLVKLSLMELDGAGTTHREPTGRVAVFSNAIVFQPSGNFFKQAPGTSFIWNEVRLTLAPDVDYRLAEKRILDAVDEVFARYRDRVMRDYRHLERDLNVMLETPKPQSRLHLSQSGLEIVIRYPAETYSAPQITDEISRRVLDAINREPSLRLAAQGIANIQSQVPPPATAEDGAEKTGDGNGQPVEDKSVAPEGQKVAGSTASNK